MEMNENCFDLSGVAKRLRILVKNSIRFSENSDAVFWADKLVSMTSNNVEDFYLLCRALHSDRQFKRCAILIKDSGLEGELPIFRLLAARLVFF